MTFQPKFPLSTDNIRALRTGQIITPELQALSDTAEGLYQRAKAMKGKAGVEAMRQRSYDATHTLMAAQQGRG